MSLPKNLRLHNNFTYIATYVGNTYEVRHFLKFLLPTLDVLRNMHTYRITGYFRRSFIFEYFEERHSFENKTLQK